MKRHLRLIAPALGIVVVVATLAGCQLYPKPFDVSVTLSSKQYAGAQNADGSFTLYFPNVTTYNSTLPNGGEVASSGNVNGATIVSVTVKSNETFYVTGAKIENVRYWLMPIGTAPNQNPFGTSSPIAYVNPQFGEMSPIFANLALGSNGSSSAVIKINPNVDNSFDLGLSSALSLWDSIDVDRDGVYFPQDQKEVIDLTCSVFFEGYLPDGTQFDGTFPPPLALKLVVEHAAS